MRPGVYISFPFCPHKCTFCNFASGVFPAALEVEYVDALAAEIESTRWAEDPDTVYLGGGTPSQMSIEGLAWILAKIPGSPWLEATIEAVPGTFTGENIRAWQRAGINRVSLGVQSFDVSELQRTGRRHTAETVIEDCRRLRAEGLRTINIDLIAGLAGQSETSWRKSLGEIERLSPDHVSIYLLEVDEDSALGAEVLRGGSRFAAAEVPGDDVMAEFYELAVSRLQAMGLARYEVSNFARPGFTSLHNLKYWQLAPYLGFGVDAHSFDGAERWANQESLNEYLRCHHEQRSPRLFREAARPAEERFFVGLRLTSGIRPTEEEWQRFSTPIARFVEAGLLERSETALRLTDRGVLLSNEVLQEFVGIQ